MRLAGEAGADDARGVAPLLHRDRRDSGQQLRLAVRVTDADHVAEREHLGVPGQREVGLDRHPARAVELRAGELAEPAGEARSGDAGGPDHDPARDALGGPVAVGERDAVVVDPDDRPTREHRDAEPLAASARPSRESEGGKLVSTRSAASTSRMRALRGSMSRKSRRSVSRASSAIWPAISTPVGPAPTTTNVSQASRSAACGVDLGGLEGGEEAAADGERALERLHLGAVRPPVVVAEVGVGASRPRRQVS